MWVGSLWAEITQRAWRGGKFRGNLLGTHPVGGQRRVGGAGLLHHQLDHRPHADVVIEIHLGGVGDDLLHRLGLAHFLMEVQQHVIDKNPVDALQHVHLVAEVLVEGAPGHFGGVQQVLHGGPGQPALGEYIHGVDQDLRARLRRRGDGVMVYYDMV